MFTRLAAKRVQHASGYIVQAGGRYAMEYLDETGRKAIVKAEILDTPITLFARGVLWEDLADPTEDERVEIVERVRMGLAAMGEDAVVVDR
jgi:hypothetical protein